MSAEPLQPVSLINALMHPDQYDPPIDKCELIETHISWVILAGSYAYKIKKSLNLGFLDFSTLEKRQFYCNEELRLNKRLAAAVYLCVVPITGSMQQPKWAGNGNVIEYAVKMRAFPQEVQLDRVSAHGALQCHHIDKLARHIASFHARIDVAAFHSEYGEPQVVHQPIEENFLQIREHLKNTHALQTLTTLESWAQTTFTNQHTIFKQRKTDGFIRECHGDMHLRNIAWVDDAPLLFDCIEFSPSLRWIDVINDVAFLIMDLQDRKEPELAQRFLNNYLDHTGDYPGIMVLRYYQMYRALVRAKIDTIRAHQPGISSKEKAEAENDFLHYLNLALEYTESPKPQLFITRGLSASGKSTVSQSLLEHLGAVRIRSDVERKRLFGLRPGDGGQTGIGEGIYSTEATERTYRKLEELAAIILNSGYSVIIDAVFLHYSERERFQKLAEAQHTPFMILECTANPEILRHRIEQRKKDVSDADLRVLEMQIAQWQPLQENECKNTIAIDTTMQIDTRSLATEIQTRR